MIEEKLEIFILTYNRSKDLERTLKELLLSPFKDCRTTILDNCSYDNTSDICVKYKELFSNLNIVRHKINIGGGANSIRAVELAELPYIWILCDDDFYNFSDCSDIIYGIENEKYDIISVGAQIGSVYGRVYQKQKGLSAYIRDLEDLSMFLRVHTFVPSFIFKLKLFDSQCIQLAYENLPNLFPLFPFTVKAIRENYSIYIAKNLIVERGSHNDTPTVFVKGLKESILPDSIRYKYWYIGWINSCQLIIDKELRNKVIGSTYPNFAQGLYNVLMLNEIFYNSCIRNIITIGIEIGKKYLPVFFLVLFIVKLVMLFRRLFFTFKLKDFIFFNIIPNFNNYDFSKKWLKKINFQSKIALLSNKYQNKKIVIYGFNAVTKAIIDNYNLSGLNIIGISDLHIEVNDINKYSEYNIIPIKDILKFKPDVLIICIREVTNIKQALAFKKCIEDYIDISLDNIIIDIFISEHKFNDFLFNKIFKFYLDSEPVK